MEDVELMTLNEIETRARTEAFAPDSLHALRLYQDYIHQGRPARYVPSPKTASVVPISTSLLAKNRVTVLVGVAAIAAGLVLWHRFK